MVYGAVAEVVLVGVGAWWNRVARILIQCSETWNLLLPDTEISFLKIKFGGAK